MTNYQVEIWDWASKDWIPIQDFIPRWDKGKCHRFGSLQRARLDACTGKRGGAGQEVSLSKVSSQC
ncbi:hypothetical protein GCM10027085_50890 [Spirosoma aerophilum]